MNVKRRNTQRQQHWDNWLSPQGCRECLLCSFEFWHGSNLGTANWTGGPSAFLCTCRPAWQETAWQTLMCFPGRLAKGYETPTPPHSQGWFPLKLKMLLRLLFLRKLSVTVLHMMFRPEISLSGGKRRKEAEKWRAGRGGMAIVPPVGIWQVMRGGALLIYPHREKTSCWYRWHQDLFSSTPTFLSIHPSTLEPQKRFSFVCIYSMLETLC